MFAASLYSPQSNPIFILTPKTTTFITFSLHIPITHILITQLFGKNEHTEFSGNISGIYTLSIIKSFEINRVMSYPEIISQKIQ
jgi:hypothetical protein